MSMTCVGASFDKYLYCPIRKAVNKIEEACVEAFPVVKRQVNSRMPATATSNRSITVYRRTIGTDMEGERVGGRVG